MHGNTPAGVDRIRQHGLKGVSRQHCVNRDVTELPAFLFVQHDDLAHEFRGVLALERDAQLRFVLTGQVERYGELGFPVGRKNTGRDLLRRLLL